MRLHYLMALLITFVFSIGKADATLTTNGGFETGDFTGWLTIGDVLVVDASFGTSPVGTYEALVTNGPGIFDVTLPGTFSGTPSQQAFQTLEAFLGLPALSISGFAQAVYVPLTGFISGPTEGSAIKQSFTATAGDVISFRWNYLMNDGPVADFAFVVLDGSLFFLAGAGHSQPFNSFDTPYFSAETGYHLFAATVANTGTHYIGVAVVDTADTSGNSAVVVDNLSLVSIPEPPAWLLFGFGLIGLVRRRLKPVT